MLISAEYVDFENSLKNQPGIHSGKEVLEKV